MRAAKNRGKGAIQKNQISYKNRHGSQNFTGIPISLDNLRGKTKNSLGKSGNRERTFKKTIHFETNKHENLNNRWEWYQCTCVSLNGRENALCLLQFKRSVTSYRIRKKNINALTNWTFKEFFLWYTNFTTAYLGGELFNECASFDTPLTFSLTILKHLQNEFTFCEDVFISEVFKKEGSRIHI